MTAQDLTGTTGTSNQTTTPVEPAATEQPAEGQTSGAEALVAYKDRLEKENRELREQLSAQHIRAIGLEPDKGLGKAIVKEFKGELTVEALAAFALEEYQYETTQAPTVDANVIQQAQAQADLVASASQPIVPLTEADKLAQHDAKLADPDSSRQDAEAAVRDKFAAFSDRLIPN